MLSGSRHLRHLSPRAYIRPLARCSYRTFSSTRGSYLLFFLEQHHLNHHYPAAMSESVQKIVVANPVVELDGDEMTRIIWKKIREEVRN